jgi:cation diffusion facilitator CzcD-associated flavoprotein CzcO
MSVPCAPTDVPSSNSLDIDVLRKRYQQERDKRLTRDATEQYKRPIGTLARYARIDPHTQVSPRRAIAENCDIVILGGGWCGILAGYHLARLGIKSFRHIEQGGDFGGVWYWNRYPGIQCDNDAYCYLPLLEETGFVPSRKFADGYEILDYAQSVARMFGFYESALFHTIVERLNWDDADKRWSVRTDRGDDIRARFVILANGLINTPKLPNLEGIADFEGTIFHTSRWDYEYTGGSSREPVLDKLTDKRVAIVGTGATGIQAIPYLGRYSKHLYVIQRTPSTVDFRNNTLTDPKWVAGLKPGWQRKRQRNFQSAAITGLWPGERDEICDIWTEINRNLAAELESEGWPDLSVTEYLQRREIMDYRVMERLRNRVDALVHDPKTAESLKPWYRFLCKRPASNDDYYPTFNRPNVDLIDVSSTKGLERLTRSGFVAIGKSYEIDCMIFASGFEVTSDLDRRWGMEEIVGRNGVSLYDRWADGYRTMHGMMTHGFPNLMFTGYIQSGFNATTTEQMNRHCEHLAYIINVTLGRGFKRVEPTEEGESSWVKHVRENAVDMSQFALKCTPSYFNGEGDQKKKRWFSGETYGPGWDAFENLLIGWRAAGSLQGLQLS